MTLLKTTLATLETRGWCQGATSRGMQLSVLGALWETLNYTMEPGDKRDKARKQATARLFKAAGETPLVEWNDDPRRTFSDVRDLFQEAMK